jgi:hypothetical protein
MLTLDISAGDAHMFAHKLEARPYLSQLSRRTEAKLRLGSCARAGKRAMAAITMSTSIRPDPDAFSAPPPHASPGVARAITKQA